MTEPKVSQKASEDFDIPLEHKKLASEVHKVSQRVLDAIERLESCKTNEARAALIAAIEEDTWAITEVPIGSVADRLVYYADRIVIAEPWLRKGTDFTKWATSIAAEMRKDAETLQGSSQ